jgi:hypothetical protein
VLVSGYNLILRYTFSWAFTVICLKRNKCQTEHTIRWTIQAIHFLILMYTNNIRSTLNQHFTARSPWELQLKWEKLPKWPAKINVLLANILMPRKCVLLIELAKGLHTWMACVWHILRIHVLQEDINILSSKRYISWSISAPAMFISSRTEYPKHKCRITQWQNCLPWKFVNRQMKQIRKYIWRMNISERADAIVFNILRN